MAASLECVLMCPHTSPLFLCGCYQIALEAAREETFIKTTSLEAELNAAKTMLHEQSQILDGAKLAPMVSQCRIYGPEAPPM